MSVIDKKIFVAITGASGTIYAEKLISSLIPLVSRVYLSITKTGLKVANHELENRLDNQFSLKRTLNKGIQSSEKNVLRLFDVDDFFLFRL